MKLVLLGDPVKNSCSPAFQRAALQACALSGSYTAVQATAVDMARYAHHVRTGALYGANITTPHKARALSLADHSTKIAQVVGGANTWWRAPDGSLWATNTDVIGIQHAVQALGIQPKTVLLLGAGSAARAAAIALKPTHLILVNRSPARAQALAAAIHTPTTLLRWTDDLRDAFAHADLLIQATSLPLQPKATQGAAFSALPWGSLRGAVLDLSYTSGHTYAVQQAYKHGLLALDGATMLLYQGAAAFELWTHRSAPLTAMRSALTAALDRDEDTIPLVESARRIHLC